MTEYHKIPGPFWRDPATNKLTDQWSSPELGYLADLPWNFTEKIDGTNVRIIWDGHRVRYAGRTDNAQFPTPLFEYLERTYGGEDNETLFEQKFGNTDAVLYGEGYGPKIQNGGKYRADVSVALFDVKVGQWWLSRENVEDIATYFRVPTVPFWAAGVSLNDMIGTLRLTAFQSRYGDFPIEGLVGTPDVSLFNRKGERIIVKLKTRDLSPKS